MPIQATPFRHIFSKVGEKRKQWYHNLIFPSTFEVSNNVILPTFPLPSGSLKDSLPSLPTTGHR